MCSIVCRIVVMCVVMCSVINGVIFVVLRVVRYLLAVVECVRGQRQFLVPAHVTTHFTAGKGLEFGRASGAAAQGQHLRRQPV